MNIIEAGIIDCMEEGHYKALSEIVKQNHKPNEYQKRWLKSCD